MRTASDETPIRPRCACAGLRAGGRRRHPSVSPRPVAQRRNRRHRIDRRRPRARPVGRRLCAAPAGRIEAAAPFGAPLFIFVASGADGTLFFPVTIACRTWPAGGTARGRRRRAAGRRGSAAHDDRLRDARAAGRWAGARRQLAYRRWQRWCESLPAPRERVGALASGDGVQSRPGTAVELARRLRRLPGRSAARDSVRQCRSRSLQYPAHAVADRDQPRRSAPKCFASTCPATPNGSPSTICVAPARSPTKTRGAIDERQQSRSASACRRARQDQSLAARARDAVRRLPRAADDVSVDRAARHADDPRRARAVPVDVRRSAIVRPTTRTWSGAPPRRSGRRPRRRRRAARRRDRSAEAHPDECRPRRRQQRCGGGASRASRACGASIEARGARDRRATLGADVPYFFEGGTALGLERGDLLFPLIDRRRRGSCWCCRTSACARKTRLRGGMRTRRRRGSASIAGSLKDRAASWLINDLERGRLASPSRRLRASSARLQRRGRDFTPAMSGSGSAVFGLFDVANGRRSAPRERSVDRGRGRTLVTRTLNRVQLSGTCRSSSPSDTLTVCAASAVPSLVIVPGRPASVCGLNRRRADRAVVAGRCAWSVRGRPIDQATRPLVGRGQAVRRGTLDPVFEGSNPSAPANFARAVR